MPADTAKVPADIAKMSFEEALAELDGIVRKLEQGETKLDDSIGAYERGEALRRHCDAKLKAAEAKIEKIARSADGGVTTAPLDG